MPVSRNRIRLLFGASLMVLFYGLVHAFYSLQATAQTDEVETAEQDESAPQRMTTTDFVEEGILEAHPHREERENDFAEESVDASWAEAAESTIVSNLFTSDRLAGSQLASIECRSTVCRIEVQHLDVSAYRSYAITFDRLIPWGHRTMLFLTSQSPVTSVAFVSRN